MVWLFSNISNQIFLWSDWIYFKGKVIKGSSNNEKAPVPLWLVVLQSDFGGRLPSASIVSAVPGSLACPEAVQGLCLTGCMAKNTRSSGPQSVLLPVVENELRQTMQLHSWPRVLVWLLFVEAEGKVAQWSEALSSPTFTCFTHWVFLFIFKLLQQISLEQKVPLLNKHLFTCVHAYLPTYIPYLYLKCLQSLIFSL